MRISDDARQCVVFLGDCNVDGDPSTFRPRATGFLISLHHQLAANLAYLVTVKHFASDGLPFWVRMNTKTGSVAQLIEEPDWAFHDDLTVDVAVVEFNVPSDAVLTPWDAGAIPTCILTGGSYFGPGDLTYTVGLFRAHRGRSRNIPLVHTGHIAAFSEDEKIDVADWDSPGKRKAIDAYIVQCSAMPGASGSPVFIRSGVKVAKASSTPSPRTSVVSDGIQFVGIPSLESPKAYGTTSLLGIWQGSWELPNEDAATQNVRYPAGYGIVVPGEKIMEILQMPKLKERREAARRG